MYSNVLKEFLGLNVIYDPNNGYKAEDETWWEIIPESESSYKLDAYKETIKENLQNELTWSDFNDLICYIDWDKYLEENFTLEDFNWEKYELDGISYYIKQY